MKMYLITNGKIITEETILHGYDLYIEEDEIRWIGPSGTIAVQPGTEIIDARGVIFLLALSIFTPTILKRWHHRDQRL